ncbi:MAG: PQQ-binding-like beta-propeller repeat protein [Desulfuromonadales bacterium]|nr:PQQ-binding-like beta-propeller repeat protein [Desulfuromonadales bacterium]
MVGRRLLCLVILLCAGCVHPDLPPAPLALHNAEILTDTTWSGRIVINGQVKVFKGATLTIAPGSDIAFIRRDDDKDGLGDGTLIVEGSLRAIGTAAQPIRFRSAAMEPQPGDWLEIRVDFSKETQLRYCEIRDSAHALHAHFTKAIVEDSHIHHNIDGSRLGQGNFIFRRNLIEENEGKGINFRNATIDITANIIRHNGAGIFLFETDRPPTIAHNNIYANTDNLRLGDFFHRDLQIGSNWWGTAVPDEVSATIYDQEKDATLGRADVGIATAWFEDCGPKDPVQLRQHWSVATNGFVDAAPQVIGTDLLIASWDGSVRRINREGQTLWSIAGTEVIDAPLLVAGEHIFGQNWGREIFALSAKNGARLWSFSYPPSPADDHRQGGLLLAEGQLLVPTWNGTFYALDPQSGNALWSFATKAPLRATPLIEQGRIFLAGGDGTLWCLDLQGRLVWERQGPAPLLTPPVKNGAGIIILDRAGNLSALSVDGTILWQQVLKETCYYAAPIHTEEGIFVATAAGALWKIDPASGTIIWRKDGFGPIYATPLALQKRLILGDNNGSLWVIGAISGNILSRRDFPGAIQGGPVAFSGGIALGSRDQQLHYLTLQELIEP